MERTQEFDAEIIGRVLDISSLLQARRALHGLLTEIKELGKLDFDDLTETPLPDDEEVDHAD